ncbi:MAG: HK97 gp10 family phage protein [Parvimonas sp.]|nr:HK97 gp10 family phage protein [Parvimonas sp.]
MKIEGLDRLYRKIARLHNIDIKPIIEDATIRVRDEAKMRVPVDTGELQNSIDYNVDISAKGFTGKVFTNKEHGLYVELGTGPKGEASHIGISPEIKPIYSPSGWVYYDTDKQKFIFTNGQPARPFMYPALHDNREKISKFIQEKVQRKIEEASK